MTTCYHTIHANSLEARPLRFTSSLYVLRFAEQAVCLVREQPLVV